MKIEIKGFDVWFGADIGADNYTLNIPQLKIFKTYTIKKNPIAALEDKAKTLITQKLKK